MESPTATLLERRAYHDRDQAVVERELEAKNARKEYILPFREEYEQARIKIHSLASAAANLQGEELEALNFELENTQQELQTTEREFLVQAETLSETMKNWEVSWKSFCDKCQDLEEERIGSMHQITWAYTNAIATVCVDDDEVS